MLTVIMLWKTQNLDRPEHGERGFWQTHGWDYVQKLVRGCDRYIKEPWRALLLTDMKGASDSLPKIFGSQRFVYVPLDAREDDFGARAMPVEIAPLVGPGHGWWAKLEMFRPDLGLEDWALYLDLDNVVSGDLSLLLNLRHGLKAQPHEGDAVLHAPPVLMLDDIVFPRMPNGSTILFDPLHGDVHALWEEYRQRPRAVEAAFSDWRNGRASDQAFVADRMKEYGWEIPLMQDYLPPGYVLNSRVELEQGADWSKTSLVYGSWDPKPHVSTHEFYQEHWR